MRTYTGEVAGIVSFVFLELKGSDCAGARARNEKGSSPAHAGVATASLGEYGKGQNHRIK